MTIVGRKQRGSGVQSAGGVSAAQPRIKRNDYTPLKPPELGAWAPTLDVSVIIPAHGGQEKLDLTLAALAAQSYPAHLMEVVVVDDGSRQPLELPAIKPEGTRLIPSAEGGWGSGHAVNTGVAATEGTVVMRLDSDMLAYREHVESQMRWHHLADYAVAMGHKMFTDFKPGAVPAQRAFEAVKAGEAAQLFDMGKAQPHWVERIINNSDTLKSGGPMAYQVFIGATGSLRRDVFHAAGGMDPALILGGDSEFAYRVGQTGAVFIPDLDTSSWHLGQSQMQQRRDEGTRFRHPYVANRLPLLQGRRKTAGRQWLVPCVDVVIDLAGAGFDSAEATLARLLNGKVGDIRISLVGDWDKLTGDRRSPLNDPFLDLRLLQEMFGAEPRVRFVQEAPEVELAVPYRLFLPAGLKPEPLALHRILEAAKKEEAGLLRVVLPKATAEGLRYVRLERTAAFARARHLGATEADIDTVVEEVYGVHWMDGAGPVVKTEADGTEPPEVTDWKAEAEKWKRQAEQQKKRADRLHRKAQWITRSGIRRLARRVIGS